MRHFIHRHPVMYSRLLLLALILVAASGVGSVFASSDSSGSTPALFTPPANTLTAKPATKIEEATATPNVVQTNKIPGEDGSAPVPAAAPSGDVIATVAVSGSTNEIRTLGRTLNATMFDDSQWPALEALWNRESGWNPNALNRRSGACGIPQALPCSKISDHSTQGQILWGLGYIKSRYGTPTQAWRFWLSHGWY